MRKNKIPLANILNQIGQMENFGWLETDLDAIRLPEYAEYEEKHNQYRRCIDSAHWDDVSHEWSFKPKSLKDVWIAKKYFDVRSVVNPEYFDTQDLQIEFELENDFEEREFERAKEIMILRSELLKLNFVQGSCLAEPHREVCKRLNGMEKSVRARFAHFRSQDARDCPVFRGRSDGGAGRGAERVEP